MRQITLLAPYKWTRSFIHSFIPARRWSSTCTRHSCLQ